MGNVSKPEAVYIENLEVAGNNDKMLVVRLRILEQNGSKHTRTYIKEVESAEHWEAMWNGQETDKELVANWVAELFKFQVDVTVMPYIRWKLHGNSSYGMSVIDFGNTTHLKPNITTSPLHELSETKTPKSET